MLSDSELEALKKENENLKTANQKYAAEVKQKSAESETLKAENKRLLEQQSKVEAACEKLKAKEVSVFINEFHETFYTIQVICKLMFVFLSNSRKSYRTALHITLLMQKAWRRNWKPVKPLLEL